MYIEMMMIRMDGTPMCLRHPSEASSPPYVSPCMEYDDGYVDILRA